MNSHLTVHTGAARIHCTIGAGTGPAVLFLNGAFSTRRDWKHVLRALSPDLHTVTFDARGRGRSADSPDYSFSGALEDVGSVIEATKLVRPVLVGWSHGATLALRYAATHPGEVAGVVLVDGAFPVTRLPREGPKTCPAAIPAAACSHAHPGVDAACWPG